MQVDVCKYVCVCVCVCRQLSSVSEDNGAPHTPLVGLLATPQSPMDTTSPDQVCVHNHKTPPCLRPRLC